MKYIWTQRCV